MTTLTTAVPCGSAILTEAELNAASGGRAPSDYLDGWSPRVPQMNPFQYAYAYWSVSGVGGTFRDFAWQLRN